VSGDPPNADPSAPAPPPVDDSRARRDQTRERSPGSRDGALPGTGTYDPMPEPLGKMS
jgi:hypothetical protein